MITIAYFRGANKEMQDKVKYAHGKKLYNTLLQEVIKKILDTGYNIMIQQIKNDKPPRKNYIVWIDDKRFEQR